MMLTSQTNIIKWVLFKKYYSFIQIRKSNKFNNLAKFKHMKYLLGPEMIWLLLYASAVNITKSQILPPKTLDEFIANSWYWVPLIVLLSFSIYWMPFVGKNLLMLRVWVICLVFGHLLLEHLTSAYSQQGPGIGTTYIAGMLFTFIALIVGSIVVKIAL